MPASNPRIDELRKKFDENPRRYFAPLANEYRKAGELDQAIEICRTHLKEQPSHMSGHVVFGQALYEARQFEEGRQIFEAALQLDPENLIALKHLGDIERELGNPSRARGWYQRVLDADPRNEEIQNQLASLPAEEPSPAAPVADTPEASGEDAGILGNMDWSDVAPAETPAAHSEATTLVMDRVPAPEPSPIEAAPVLDLRESSGGMPAIEETPPPVDATEGLEATHFALPDAHVEEQGPLAGLSGNFEQPPDDAAPLIETPASHAFDPGATAQMPPMDLTVPEMPRPELPALDLPAATVAAAGQEPRPSVDDMIAWKTPATVTPISSVSVSSPSSDPLLDESFAEFTPPSGVPVQPAPAAPAAPAEAAAEAEAAPASLDEALWAPQPAAAPVDEPMVEQAEEETPGAFVTETMAELYVRQGLIEHAVGVYRQLVSQSPGDTRLRARLDELEGRPPVAAEPEDMSLTRELRAPSGPSMREILARIARHRPGESAPEGVAAGVVSEASVAPEMPGESGATAAQADRSPGSGGAVVGGGLSSLFGGRGVRVEDEAAAVTLSTLYANGGGEARVTGQPTRRASDEFSLDRVFSDAPRKSAEVRRSQGFSFDQFFSEGAPQSASPNQPTDPQPHDADIAQFNSWLEGLKKK